MGRSPSTADLFEFGKVGERFVSRQNREMDSSSLRYVRQGSKLRDILVSEYLNVGQLALALASSVYHLQQVAVELERGFASDFKLKCTKVKG